MPSPDTAGDSPQPPLLYDLTEHQWLVIDGVVAVAAWLLVELDLRGVHGPGRPVALALALLVAVAVAVRRRWPLPALVVGTLAVGGETALGRPLLELSLMLGLVTYMVARRVPRQLSIRALVAVEGALVVALFLGVKLSSLLHGSIGADSIESVLPVAAAWFVGESITARRAYIAGLVEQAELQRATEIERGRQAVRLERVRIARELHDVVAHSLAVITVQAGVSRRLLDKQPEQARTALESIEVTGRTAQDELRLVLGLLRDDDTELAALEPAPGLADLKALVETVQAAGNPVELHVSGADNYLSPALQLSVYRIIQEALTNVVKHAPGAPVRVQLAVSAVDLRIEVADEGPVAGSDEPGEAVPPGSQHGIVGMHERVGAFGGSLVAEARPDAGFHVVAQIPLKDRT